MITNCPAGSETADARVKEIALQSGSRQPADSWPYPHHGVFESELQRNAESYFRRKGYNVQKKKLYILAERQQWRNNIILTEVAGFIESKRNQRASQHEGFPLHAFIHHGLSSQAMLFNLIGPLVIKGDFEPIRAVLGAKGVNWPEGKVTAQFEVEDRDVFNETHGQPTSIDLVLHNDSGPSLFIEAKFVEHEFGGCSVFKRGDCDGRNPAGQLSLCYLYHIGHRYWELMSDHDVLNDAWKSSPVCPLASYYQFFRVLLFALHHNGLFVFLHDERNPTFSCNGPDGYRGIFAFLVSTLPQVLRSKIIEVSIQELFESILKSGRHTDWTGEFAEKYGMTAGES
jgi:POLQ-like helicase